MNKIIKNIIIQKNYPKNYKIEPKKKWWIEFSTWKKGEKSFRTKSRESEIKLKRYLMDIINKHKGKNVSSKQIRKNIIEISKQ